MLAVVLLTEAIIQPTRPRMTLLVVAGKGLLELDFAFCTLHFEFSKRRERGQLPLDPARSARNSRTCHPRPASRLACIACHRTDLIQRLARAPTGIANPRANSGSRRQNPRSRKNILCRLTARLPPHVPPILRHLECEIFDPPRKPMHPLQILADIADTIHLLAFIRSGPGSISTTRHTTDSCRFDRPRILDPLGRAPFFGQFANLFTHHRHPPRHKATGHSQRPADNRAAHGRALGKSRPFLLVRIAQNRAAEQRSTADNRSARRRTSRRRAQSRLESDTATEQRQNSQSRAGGRARQTRHHVRVHLPLLLLGKLEAPVRHLELLPQNLVGAITRSTQPGQRRNALRLLVAALTFAVRVTPLLGHLPDSQHTRQA